VCAAIKDDTRSRRVSAGVWRPQPSLVHVAQHNTKGETYAAILCGANMNFDRPFCRRARRCRRGFRLHTTQKNAEASKRFCALIMSYRAGHVNHRVQLPWLNDTAALHVFFA
jgi:threonine dehydratase